MGDKTHAAGVMLVGGVVQTLGLRAVSLNHADAELGRMYCRRRNPFIPRFSEPGF
jgi:hypothetical protein